MADFDYVTRDILAQLPSAAPGGVLQVLPFTVTLATGALALNKTSRVARVPAGFTLWGLSGNIADLDTGTALVWDLGSTADPDLLIDGSSAGQSAAALDTDDLVIAALGYRFTADTDIIFTTKTAAGTAVAGDLKLGFIGVMA